VAIHLFTLGDYIMEIQSNRWIGWPKYQRWCQQHGVFKIGGTFAFMCDEKKYWQTIHDSSGANASRVPFGTIRFRTLWR